MIVTTYLGWARDAKPFKDCQPTLDLIATLRRYGYTGPGTGYPDERHQLADPPEDHTPYSHTPWPGAQPYPYGMAIDIMPGHGIDVMDLGVRLVADRNRRIPGTEPIKYINWTSPVTGQCWHSSWQPKFAQTPSTDRGHVHISFRTDFYTSKIMSQYDPFGGEEMYFVIREAGPMQNAAGRYGGGTFQFAQTGTEFDAWRELTPGPVTTITAAQLKAGAIGRNVAELGSNAPGEIPPHTHKFEGETLTQ